ncbi:hypothetical protein [Paenibacillus albidus]|uniref:hypothetical protein n=1 Tax=Paenibacillus albidus TaxID=2041023 RepID=UPI001667F875|nr:hypothetical protein [Paenibacillus albidus]
MGGIGFASALYGAYGFQPAGSVKKLLDEGTAYMDQPVHIRFAAPVCLIPSLLQRTGPAGPHRPAPLNTFLPNPAGVASIRSQVLASQSSRNSSFGGKTGSG